MAYATDSTPFSTTDAQQQNLNGHFDNDVSMTDSMDNQAAFSGNAEVSEMLKFLIVALSHGIYEQAAQCFVHTPNKH